ncbi:hypothetical protein FVEN_g5971 [Fusarium venenatum]|uniref:Rhodopsin domain-containing protein n=1 Tax=Fusarium venenatum TaxID=56646 RepID=A0A2L2SXB4_9HYPO|nr:uncharacterized protein FVRRES_05745 [Fusarium venenatum]KAG8356229.1 hypothetical protein FVEN_g5971 [Fusarium venenatum]CEI61309.1 unnamed protein product [Fusarium venenatum]
MRTPGAHDILVSEILVVIAVALVAARLNLRLRIQKRRLILSDKFMIAACISGVIAAAFTPAFAALDAFDPKVHSTLEGYSGNRRRLRLILKLLFASNFPFYTTLYLCKAVLLSVYLQAFPEFMVKRRRFLWATICFTAISYVTTMILVLCICLPLERHWDLDADVTCQAWTYAVNFNVGWALSFLGDILVFILPWLIVPALQVKRALRLGIYFTFLLGIVNIVVSLVRFIMIFKAGADSSISLSTIVLWSALDVNMGLMIACLPSLRPYFGSRTQSEKPSFESRNEERFRRPSKFGIDTLRHNYRKYDEEESSSSSERQNTGRASNWENYEGVSDDGRRSCTDVSDVALVELRLPPSAKVPQIEL